MSGWHLQEGERGGGGGNRDRKKGLGKEIGASMGTMGSKEIGNAEGRWRGQNEAGGNNRQRVWRRQRGELSPTTAAAAPEPVGEWSSARSGT